MVQLLYNLLLAAIAPLAIPYWIARGRARGHSWVSVLEALGCLRFPKDTTNRPAVWFHAVSVGEVQSSLPLLRALRRKLPESSIYVSTGTATGRKLAEDRLKGVARGVFRAPVDLPWCVSRIFSALRPRLLVVAETELWPNYFFQAERHSTPSILVNGRISDRSASRYRKSRALFRPVLRSIDSILVQSDTDRIRFLEAGARPSGTLVGGNLKYDFDSRGAATELPMDIGKFLDGCDARLLLLAGSTREGEESMLVPTLLAVAKCEPRALFAVAPRHPHRFDEAASVLGESGLPVVRRSDLGSGCSPELPAILLVDSLGELAALYRRADLVFVGGSLNGWGGHNVLEPVAFGKPVVVGPHMQNFQQIVDDLLGTGGLVQVAGIQGLATRLTELAASEEQRTAIGLAGKQVADSKRGASERAADEAVRLFRQALPRQPPSILAALSLGIPSKIWRAVARARRSAYGGGLLRSRTLSSPVVCVGNITAGGTGKTPTVAWLVEQLAVRGHSSAVLTRGYGRTDTTIRLVPATESVDPLLAGDEPAMLAARFARTAPGTIFAVGADRYAAGRQVEERGAHEFLILDDGFQHLQLRRSLDIVLIDASEPFGNGHTLPLGRLREPVCSLGAADIVIVTRCNPDFDYAAVERIIREANPTTSMFYSRMVARDLVDLKDGSIHALDALAGKRVAAFCGVGNPQSFFDEARRLAGELVLARSYRDHHRYTRRDVRRIDSAATDQFAEVFLTTEKDAVNLGSVDLPRSPTYALRIDLRIERAEELLRQVLSLIPSRGTRR